MDCFVFHAQQMYWDSDHGKTAYVITEKLPRVTERCTLFPTEIVIMENGTVH